jgi:hypothetical protein
MASFRVSRVSRASRGDAKVGCLARFEALRRLPRRRLVKLAALGDLIDVAPGTVLRPEPVGTYLLLAGSVLLGGSFGGVVAAAPGQWLAHASAIAVTSVVLLAFGPAERAAAAKCLAGGRA